MGRTYPPRLRRPILRWISTRCPGADIPQQALEWVTEHRELHPRSGFVVDITGGAEARPPRPAVEVRERQQRSKRRHP
ncbi:hypothetical protein NDU88_003669 [Pleurodeles waltl]|uniref:Uncharacterized protein n=1 Tax=Pleurodeles waltl TaxID=8319 RepID=A0AAV7TPS9_PLEWA|nr:hypothetical protein NDU88_003669 [Pleurodeles waltl]